MSTLTHPTRIHEDADQSAVEAEPIELVGLLAEYADVDAIMDAARGVRAAGFTRWDVHSSFPIHGIDAAIGIKPTVLPWLVLGGGLFGCFGAMWLQWYCNAYDYAFMISGKPFWSLPANIPIIFECTILLSALTAAGGMFALNRLPMLYNPLFKSDRFRRATTDRFFVVIDASDPRFDELETTELLTKLGATAVERVED
ncbi:MAG TPA: DUF3341 domain-containing protein [Tepidisphaeraceae bacterium]|nr:DUF3341 domain-containing protein [Tepidisphaeraceae bacterium]